MLVEDPVGPLSYGLDSYNTVLSSLQQGNPMELFNLARVPITNIHKFERDKEYAQAWKAFVEATGVQSL